MNGKHRKYAVLMSSHSWNDSIWNLSYLTHPPLITKDSSLQQAYSTSVFLHVVYIADRHLRLSHFNAMARTLRPQNSAVKLSACRGMDTCSTRSAVYSNA